MHTGVPVVRPLNTPLTIRKRSASVRFVEMVPRGLRRLSFEAIYSSSIFIPGASPSSTAPISLPWLSPKIVTVMLFPNVFFIMQSTSFLLSVFRLCSVYILYACSGSKSFTTAFLSCIVPLRIRSGPGRQLPEDPSTAKKGSGAPDTFLRPRSHPS